MDDFGGIPILGNLHMEKNGTGYNRKHIWTCGKNEIGCDRKYMDQWDPI